MNQQISSFQQKVEFIKNLALILGVPALIGVGIYLYDREIEVYKSEIELLKQTQYDKAFSIIDSQRKLFELEKKKLEEELQKLQESESINIDKIEILQSTESEKKILEEEKKKLEEEIRKLQGIQFSNNKKIETLKTELNTTKKIIKLWSQSQTDRNTITVKASGIGDTEILAYEAAELLIYAEVIEKTNGVKIEQVVTTKNGIIEESIVSESSGSVNSSRLKIVEKIVERLEPKKFLVELTAQYKIGP